MLVAEEVEGRLKDLRQREAERVRELRRVGLTLLVEKLQREVGDEGRRQARLLKGLGREWSALLHVRWRRRRRRYDSRCHLFCPSPSLLAGIRAREFTVGRPPSGGGDKPRVESETGYARPPTPPLAPLQTGALGAAKVVASLIR